MIKYVTHYIKQFLILLISLFLTVVTFYLSAVFPAVVLLQNGNSNPPPPFDVGPNGIYFSLPFYQIPVTLLVLLVPLFGSFIAYLLNDKKKNITVILPMVLGYLFYAFVIYTAYANGM